MADIFDVDELAEQINARRGDPAFMRRLRDRVTADRPMLAAMAGEPQRERTDPDELREDASRLLANHQGIEIDLVVSLLKHIREHADEVEWVRDGHGWSYQSLEQQHREVCDERNAYREALRAVKHAVRNVKVGRL